MQIYVLPTYIPTLKSRTVERRPRVALTHWSPRLIRLSVALTITSCAHHATPNCLNFVPYTRPTCTCVSTLNSRRLSPVSHSERARRGSRGSSGWLGGSRPCGAKLPRRFAMSTCAASLFWIQTASSSRSRGPLSGRPAGRGAGARKKFFASDCTAGEVFFCWKSVFPFWSGAPLLGLLTDCWIRP